MNISIITGNLDDLADYADTREKSLACRILISLLLRFEIGKTDIDTIFTLWNLDLGERIRSHKIRVLMDRLFLENHPAYLS